MTNKPLHDLTFRELADAYYDAREKMTHLPNEQLPKDIGSRLHAILDEIDRRDASGERIFEKLDEIRDRLLPGLLGKKNR
jgi:hypothetical protein